MKPPELILDIMRRSLESGENVEIEGLGIFRKARDGYEFAPQSQPEVFVAYVAEDLASARRVCESLRLQGCSPWLDKDKLLPGQNWPRAIRRAIESADACVVCFSPRSIAKRGQFQSELRHALDCARRVPLDGVFFIPVRLERCVVPDEIAREVQYVDLFPDWDRGIKKLVRAIRKTQRARSLALIQAEDVK